MAISTAKAKIGSGPDVARKVARLKRLRLAAAQLEKQLKTPFRSEDNKAAAERKLAAVVTERDSTIALLKANRSEIDAVLDAIQA